MVAWRWSSGLITELSLSQWIDPRLGIVNSIHRVVLYSIVSN